jgi:hypothetical protein
MKKSLREEMMAGMPSEKVALTSLFTSASVHIGKE